MKAFGEIVAVLAMGCLLGACVPPAGTAGSQHDQASGPEPGRAVLADAGRIVVVVRHAEAHREPGGDPALTPAGESRAERLAELLGDAGIEVVHTSDYRRTRSTAAPLAARLGITPVVYDARDLAGFADRLLTERGRHLVLGHSNTNPELVRLLGGEPGGEITEHEHDRVYLLVFDVDGVRTIVVRY
jgi:phosphohistidine phosphatase SixA